MISEILRYDREYDKYKTNIKLKKNGVLQSFAIADDYLYISQQQASSSGGYISKIPLNSVTNTVKNEGQYLGENYAILKNYGHVANIDIETTNGKRYLWTQCSSEKAAHCRVPLSNIRFDKSIQTPKDTIKFSGVSLVAVDPHNDTVVTMDGSRKKHIFKVYSLGEYVASKGKNIPDPIYSFKKVHKGVKYSRQGFDVDGNYIYSLEGNMSSNKNPGVFISVFKLDGTTVIYRKKVQYPNDNAFWEPEGIKVYNGHLYMGMARKDKITGKKTQYIFRVSKDYEW